MDQTPRPPSLQAPVAVDSTLMLSADSFLTRGSLASDPNAAADFRYAADIYCNDCMLYYPIPKTKVISGTPILSLWSEYGHARPSLPLSDRGKEEIAGELRPDFARLINEKPDWVIDWLGFQFGSNQMAEIFWQGGNTVADLERALPHAMAAVSGNCASDLRRIADEKRLDVPGAYEHAADVCGDIFSFGLAFTYHAFLKGYLYAANLPDVHSYHCHWLREPAINGTQVRSRAKRSGQTRVFAWGRLLQKVFDPVSPLVKPETQRIKDVFSAIRDFSRSEHSFELFGSRSPSMRQLEDYAVEGLRRAGLVPNLRLSERERMLLKVLTGAGRWAKKNTAFEYIQGEETAYFLRANWFKGKLFDWHHCFRRENLWNRYQDVGTREAAQASFDRFGSEGEGTLVRK